MKKDFFLIVDWYKFSMKKEKNYLEIINHISFVLY